MRKVIKIKKGQSFRSKLIRMRACSDGREWVGYKSLRCFWNTAERGDWMLWLAWYAGVDRKLICRATCACVRLIRIPKRLQRSLLALELAERWSQPRSRITEETLYKAEHLVCVEMRELVPSDRAKANIASSACLSGVQCDDGWIALDDLAKCAKGSLKAMALRCADIVRKHIPFAVIDAAMRGVK
jgi:hypothetical protein